MVSLDRKLDVLHHSISTFTRWLDHCSVLLETLSAFQTGLESDHDKARSDESQLRDLALQYKVSCLIPIPCVWEWAHLHVSE